MAGITYNIQMGLPEMAAFWIDMKEKEKAGTLSKQENILFKKVKKALRLLTVNPQYPGLHSHQIDELSKREKFTVYESYLENNTPAAGRIFWAYGPQKADITILGIVPHPELGGYGRVHLSEKPVKLEQKETKSESNTKKRVLKKGPKKRKI